MTGTFSGSYSIETRTGEIERLHVQSKAMAPDALAMLDRFGPMQGWTCLDIGCGPGGITDLLSARVGPKGRVIGLDMNAVPSARQPLENLSAFLYIFVETRLTMRETQISTHISQETRERVERYADAHGMKKGALVEQALLHHLQALYELPADVIIPPRLALTERSLSDVARLITKPRKPRKALRALTSGKSDDGNNRR